MTIHILKTDGDCWNDVNERRKDFEIRKDDRVPAYAADDVVCLAYSGPGPLHGKRLVFRIGYVYRGRHVPEGLCVFSLKNPIAGDGDRVAVAAGDVAVSK